MGRHSVASQSIRPRLLDACVGMLLVTMALRRLGGAPLSTCGLPLDRRRLGQLAAGFVVTGAFLAVAAVRSAMVGATRQFTGRRGLSPSS